MPRIVSVWLEHWPVTRLRRAGASSARDDGPMVVAAMEASGLRLIAVDAQARALGLEPGETLARARARIGTPVSVHPADPEADAAALHRLCLWAKRYTPVVAPFGPAEGGDGFFLDIAGASHLFGGEAQLVSDLVRRLSEGAIPARIALADTPACAFALARHGGGGLVAPGGNAEALRTLPVSALRLDPAMAQALARLGLRRIGDLAAAARAPLARRFGETLLLRLDQALGHRPEPLVCTEDPREFEAVRGFLEPVGRPETIVATATRLMAGLAPRLEAAGLGARAVRLSLTRVDGVVRTLDLGMSLPTRCPAQIERLLTLRLDRLGPALDAGFGFETIGLAVTATGTIAARQGMLVEAPDGAGAEHLGDALRQRLGRRMMRLGFRASHLPERAEIAEPWRASLPAQAARPHLPPRPLVLLGRGEAAEDVIALAPDGPPHRFRWRRRLHRVAHADGPERIADEWWQAPGPARDYYVVEDEAGRRLWVYREGFPTRETPARWFVHGLFA
ncbi:DNA polymerase Y family protein [Methylobacterium sp. J-078]|uniref:Y-family DNA polymerase n=1 Tax=Methylobacterium sp. J-078 TaxID=2836657 RepID=UPI001FB94AE5|nr:DNA polymerase Y family protein [Methylobacterium sp. J-078]MCJ2046485.1 DNA polymerase Y family protein [Methylobacterium sp. J-078]